MNRIAYMILVFSFLLACSEEKSEYLFNIKSSEETGLEFRNELGIELDLNILNYMYFYNGGGLAVADLNNDGLQDIIFSSNLGPEKSFLNLGDLKFQDISTETGIDGGDNSWTNGIAVADVNGDGLLDVYLSQLGDYEQLDNTNKLFICTEIGDDGIPRYSEQASEYGLDFKGFSTQAGFFDYDLDGDLDMFLLNHSLHHNGTFGKRSRFLNTYDTLSGDRLFRNDGKIFTDLTKESGIHSNVLGYGLGVAFSDINLDGWPDIYVGNDFHENDYLYINQKDGTFKDELDEYMMHTSRFSMGVDIADINGDIYPDIISLDMLPEDPTILKSSEGENELDVFKFKLGYGYNHQYAKNALQLNTGNGQFSDIAMMAGVHATDWSWSPLIFDMDMDGRNDIFISNGLPKRTNDIDYIDFISSTDIQPKIRFDQLSEDDLDVIDRAPEIKLFNKFYLNSGKLLFEDRSNAIRNNKESYSNSAAFADLDNDGDFDVISNNINDKAFLYENLTEKAGIQIGLKGHEINSYAVGSKLLIYNNENIQLRENFSTRGFQASSLNHFIISGELEYDSLILIWPDNHYQRLDKLQKDTIINYSSDLPVFEYEQLHLDTGFSLEELSVSFKLEYKHQENPFVEFKREPLIPHASSAEGPALCVADLNGDGLEDIFIGSSKRRWNAVFLQDKNGTFKNIGDIGIDSTYEEVDALSADFNGNGAADLVIATGGNEFSYRNAYTSQLIIYDIFTPQSRIEYLPLNITASCVHAADFDKDGDLDLFFGARAMESNYGSDVSSAILVNQGSSFDIYPSDKVKGLEKLGMVKDAMWVDFDADGYEDILIAEEWGGIHLFTNTGKEFIGKELIELKGWWNSIEVEDLDNDGDLDILAGNLGLNSRLQPSADQAVRMYYNDFDDNGKSEQILTYFIGDREVPFNNFREIKSQIPTIKKKYLYAHDFAQADIVDLFGKQKIKDSKVFEMNFSDNSVFENIGDGTFRVRPLPRELQISPIHSIYLKDFNGDGLKDIFTTGNFYNCNIQMGRYDADYGSLALNNGDCTFTKKHLSGHSVKGQVRYCKPILLKTGQELLVLAKNNGPLELINIKSE